MKSHTIIKGFFIVVLCVSLVSIVLCSKHYSEVPLSVRDGAELIMRTCRPNSSSDPISLDGPSGYAGYVLNEFQVGENQKAIFIFESYDTDENFYYYRLYERIIDDLRTGESHEVTHNFYAIKISSKEIFQRPTIGIEWELIK